MNKLYDLVVKTGSYTDRKGNEKARWLNVGSLMEKDGNKFIMLHKTFSPAGVPDLSGRGGDSVLISMFEPKDRDQQQSAPEPRAQRGFDDAEVPF